MKNKRYFFLYQNSTELNLIKFIINLLPVNEIEIILFCVDTFRINKSEISKYPFKTILIDEIIYSKYLYKESLKLKVMKAKLKSLGINKSDTFVTQPLYSLNNFILYRAFKNKKSNIITYALNSIKFKGNKSLNLSFYKSFKHSIFTLFYSRKLIFFYNVKNTAHNFVFTKTFSDIHIDIGPSVKNEMIISKNTLSFNKALTKSDRINGSKKILLLLRSHSSCKIFGFNEDIYLSKINHIIKYLKSKSFFIVVKNHPSSKIPLEDLMSKLDLNIENGIDSNEDLESFLHANSKDFIYFLTEDSSVALTLDFLNLDYNTINELLLKDSSVYSHIFGLNILSNLEKLTTKPKIKSNYYESKELLNKYISNV